MPNSRYASAGLGAIGMIALALAGYLKITTPEAVQCQVELADKTARLEMTDEAIAACRVALESCSAISSPTPTPGGP